MAKRSKSEVTEAAVALRAHLANIPEIRGKRTIYGLVRSVSKSGMQRQISLFVCADGELVDITYHASCLTGWGIGNNRGVRVRGCGMDMVFHLVDCVLDALHTLQDGSSGIRNDWQTQFRVEAL